MPSSPFGRVMGFAQLGASLVYGTMSDSVSQYFGGPKPAETDPQKPSNRCGSTPQKGYMLMLMLHHWYGGHAWQPDGSGWQC